MSKGDQKTVCGNKKITLGRDQEINETKDKIISELRDARLSIDGLRSFQNKLKEQRKRLVRYANNEEDAALVMRTDKMLKGLHIAIFLLNDRNSKLSGKSLLDYDSSEGVSAIKSMKFVQELIDKNSESIGLQDIRECQTDSEQKSVRPEEQPYANVTGDVLRAFCAVGFFSLIYALTTKTDVGNSGRNT